MKNQKREYPEVVFILMEHMFDSSEIVDVFAHRKDAETILGAYKRSRKGKKYRYSIASRRVRLSA